MSWVDFFFPRIDRAALRVQLRHHNSRAAEKDRFTQSISSEPEDGLRDLRDTLGRMLESEDAIAQSFHLRLTSLFAVMAIASAGLLAVVAVGRPVESNWLLLLESVVEFYIASQILFGAIRVFEGLDPKPGIILTAGDFLVGSGSREAALRRQAEALEDVIGEARSSNDARARALRLAQRCSVNAIVGYVALLVVRIVAIVILSCWG